MSELQRAIERDGFVVVPGLLSVDDVTRARTLVRQHLDARGIIQMQAKTQPNAAVVVPQLAWLFHHPAVIEVYRQLFGGDPFLFTGHADAHRDMPSDWHRDDGSSLGRATGYFETDQYSSDCRVYKVGLYLNDHRTDGRGLTVRRGSHASATAGGEAVYLPTQPVDAVFFDVRITHRGSPPDTVERMLRRAAAALGDPAGRRAAGWRARRAYFAARRLPPKLSVFFTFGADNELTKDFSRNTMARQLAQTDGIARPLPADLVDGLARQGVAVAPLS